jgi:hypothetical protein
VSTGWGGGGVRPMPGPPAAMLVALGLLECTMRLVAPAVLIVLVVWRGCVYPFYHEVFHFSFLFLGALCSMLSSLMVPDEVEDLVLLLVCCIYL